MKLSGSNVWAVLTARCVRQPGLKLILLCGNSSNTSSTAALAPQQLGSHAQVEYETRLCEVATGSSGPWAAPRRFCWWWGAPAMLLEVSSRNSMGATFRVKEDIDFCEDGRWL